MASPRLWFGVLLSISEPKLAFPLKGLQKLPSSENVLGRLYVSCLTICLIRDEKRMPLGVGVGVGVDLCWWV